MEILSRTSSFPELSLKPKPVPKAYGLNRSYFCKSIVKRLYTKDIRLIRLKSNSFWHENKQDKKIEKNLLDLKTKKSQCLKKHSSIPVFPKLSKKAESSSVSKLIKLQETMNQLIFASMNPFEERLSEDSTHKNSQKLDSNEPKFPEEGALANPEELIVQYKRQLAFIDTRIKVIITSLPKAKQKEAEMKKFKRNSKINQKMQSMNQLLEQYQNSKNKINSLIEVCNLEIFKAQQIKKAYNYFSSNTIT